MGSISTRTGDDGTTALRYGRRVPKTHSRVAAYGAVDELTALLGVIREHNRGMDIDAKLQKIQREILVLCGELATDDADQKKLEAEEHRMRDEHLADLDGLVEQYEARGTPFTGFVLSGDQPGDCWFHLARTVCRRAERAVHVMCEQGHTCPGLIPRYLNRLSDVLWLMATDRAGRD